MTKRKKYLKVYDVMSSPDYETVLDNYAGDLIHAESPLEALKIYKQWLIENGCDPEEVKQKEYRVFDILAGKLVLEE